MRQNQDEVVRLCHEHADWCADQAQAAVRKDVREEFLHLAQQWLKLARGYEVASRTDKH
jgi:hypothetical protein